MFLDNVIFHFYKGGGVTPLTGPPNLDGFSSIIRGGGGVKSLLTNVNKKMVFFNEGFPKSQVMQSRAGLTLLASQVVGGVLNCRLSMRQVVKAKLDLE